MICVVIPTLNAEQTLGPAMSGLMKAAIDGLVREVIVVDGGSTDATLDVADDAGAEIVRARGDVGALLAAGCAAAGSPWILTLRPRGRVLPGWEAVTGRHIETAPGRAAWFAMRKRGWLRGRWLGDGAALLMPSRAYAESGGFAAGSAEARLGRRLGRLSRLDVPVLEGV